MYVIYYYTFRSGMIFKSKMWVLNHSIYISIWKPNRSVHSMVFLNFCFLKPLPLRLGSKTSTGLYKMYCNSVEMEMYFILQNSLTFPLILGVGVVEIQARTEILSVRSVVLFSFFLTYLCFKEAIYEKQLYKMRSSGLEMFHLFS